METGTEDDGGQAVLQHIFTKAENNALGSLFQHLHNFLEQHLFNKTIIYIPLMQ